jgi:hypothetical protein
LTPIGTLISFMAFAAAQCREHSSVRGWECRFRLAASLSGSLKMLPLEQAALN